MIESTIVAHTISREHQCVSVESVLPRIVLAELNTHRVFSRNSASSRAIPFKRMLRAVLQTPFIPIGWQKEHTGMQGTEYFTDKNLINELNEIWLTARSEALKHAMLLNEKGATKQLANRLLEPFMYHRVLVTATEWDNFFELRGQRYTTEEGEVYHTQEDYLADAEFNAEAKIPKTVLEWLQLNKAAVEIHFGILTESIRVAMNNSVPKALDAGQWHIPYENKIEYGKISQLMIDHSVIPFNDHREMAMVKVACGMAARTSYTTVEGSKDIGYGGLLDIHDRHIVADPPHSSIYEHCNMAMYQKQYDNYTRTYLDLEDNLVVEKGWCNNVRGYIQYRHFIDRLRKK